MLTIQKNRVTLQDIAVQLGVSKSTVAKVLGNRPESRVSEKVTRRVRDTAKAMGYQPNYIAQSLRTGQTCLIGLIVPNIGIADSPGFYHDMYMGVLKMATQSDYTLVHLLTQPREKLKNIVMRGLLDGILFITSDTGNSDVDFLAETGLPMIVINREVTDREVSFVTHEYCVAAAKVVRDLVKVGHRRLALLAMGGKSDSNQQLIKGFHEQVRDLAPQGVSGVWFDISDNKFECYCDTARQVVENGPFDAYIVDIARQAEVLGKMIREKTGQIIGLNKDFVVFSPEENTYMDEVIPWQLYKHQNEYMGQQAFCYLLNQIDKGEKKTQRCFVPFQIITKST